ncbi:hypothetical protein AWZ03_004038 [Drosophila navojoa]|uniref:Distal membrane-arm assembly complex protein 1-like domain-containing protein n=1 Tax=Drosophila navojoa TaxID=7232 RepID=A0A484BL78_DRONA|nr:uncharacterized protein LOC108649002 [Drosophila navojoa]TDG49547.1 hypothetical protein AWZ03_004038 [Drosophila navojoa]
MIGKLSAWYRDNVSESVECVSCRLISGFGMLGIGAFLLSQAKRRRSPVEHYAMKSIAAVAGFLGVARLADADFLKAKAEPAKEPKKLTGDHPFFKR